jgi:hypothetical protein
MVPIPESIPESTTVPGPASVPAHSVIVNSRPTSIDGEDGGLDTTIENNHEPLATSRRGRSNEPLATSRRGRSNQVAQPTPRRGRSTHITEPVAGPALRPRPRAITKKKN